MPLGPRYLSPDSMSPWCLPTLAQDFIMFRWSLCSFCLFHTLQVKCCPFSFLFNFILLISDRSSRLPRSFKHHIVLHVVQVNLMYECIHIRLYVFSLPTLATLFWVRPQSKSNCFILNNRGHGQGSHKTSVSTCRGHGINCFNNQRVNLMKQLLFLIFHWIDW